MKPLILITISVFVFLGLVFYNYTLAQNRLKEERPSQLAVELQKTPPSVSVNQPANFSWRVLAPESFFTTDTAIYWSYDSTPSALVKYDSPDAVKYTNNTPDYLSGHFQLPQNFDLNIAFNRPGTVYYRAYAKVGNNYLWTDEKSIKILP